MAWIPESETGRGPVLPAKPTEARLSGTRGGQGCGRASSRRALRQAENETTVVDIVRKLRVTETTFYRWKKQYTELDVSELRELKQLRDENSSPERRRGGSNARQNDAPRGAWEKMVSLSQRRAVLAWAQQAYQVRERRACRGFAVHRAMIHYRSVKPDDAPVRRRLHDVAKDRPAFSVRRLHTMQRRDGLVMKCQ